MKRNAKPSPCPPRGPRPLPAGARDVMREYAQVQAGLDALAERLEALLPRLGEVDKGLERCDRVEDLGEVRHASWLLGKVGEILRSNAPMAASLLGDELARPGRTDAPSRACRLLLGRMFGAPEETPAPPAGA